MSLTKAQIARLRALREKREREAAGLFVVEGAKVVAELLAGGVAFTELYATDDWQAPAGEGPSPASAPAAHLMGKLVRVSPAEMARVSHFPTPSPVLAVGPLRRAALAPGELAGGLTLALDRVQDAGNVGTLLRIADWFGFARVLLAPECADLFSQKVINASMGSFARVRAITTALAPALRGAVAGGVPVLGCDLDGTALGEITPPRDGVIVIGSEGRGLSPEVAACVTQRLTIPRRGRAESLNAAVAAGVVCAWAAGAV